MPTIENIYTVSDQFGINAADRQVISMSLGQLRSIITGVDEITEELLQKHSLEIDMFSPINKIIAEDIENEMKNSNSNVLELLDNGNTESLILFFDIFKFLIINNSEKLKFNSLNEAALQA